MYADRTLDIILQKKPLNFHFNTRNHFRDEITRLDGFVGGAQFSKWRLVQNVAKCKY